MGPEIHMLLLMQDHIESHQLLPAQSGVGSQEKESIKTETDFTSLSLFLVSKSSFSNTGHNKQEINRPYSDTAKKHINVQSIH